MRILRLKQVKNLTGLSRSSIYGIAHFPRPIKLTDSGKCVGWLESEVVEWINGRVTASRPPATPPQDAQAPA